MTDGADFDSKLKIVEQSLIVRKGTQADVDSYSAFFDNCKLTKTQLDDELKQRGISDLYICGLATDVCVCKFLKIFITLCLSLLM
jgi:nicotinamidase/pyrazinamidase